MCSRGGPFVPQDSFAIRSNVKLHSSDGSHQSLKDEEVEKKGSDNKALNTAHPKED